ncbi:phenylacetate-CoA ligase [Halogeometricum borinquense DSM 11551]|uniref:Phenylacetate-CoA ligase n=2 Tax=Halogeometricum borinquense TaxID=60847 RepID=E4NWC8_HALBP|nr:phenylacetate--CoA ligase PaaK [Halogeometricum borinquense]ADQ69348.1 phenylacetate-CoA ligase [Halogeometricum borinquense DSM 11551]ELY26239.1 phenylacetate-CoA ligase [Halogeometricum borinquense DSM 11551]RYJ19553.1 phenylacetate--CoA ligase [Halogeometricum borinquense]
MVHRSVETASREELRTLQTERLQEAVRNAYESVPFYREKLEEMGLKPGDIERIDDVQKLPFTTKEDFRDNYPTEMFAVDMDDVVRIHASSGTTGKPKIVSYTQDDLDVWSDAIARCLVAAGLDSDDVVQNAYGYGLFTGGLGLHQGVEELGATVIPIGGGQTQRQVEMLADLESDALACTPSYALYLAETAAEMGVDIRDLPLRLVIFGAEPCTEPMREEIEERLGVTGVDIYGLSEIVGPGVSIECLEQDGLHVWEDRFYPEVVDPQTGEPVEEGEEGELVLTTLSKDALPVLRYRTGDLTTLNYDTCDCGRTAVRMDNITGRADDLLIVRGVNVYPSEIESVVLEFDEVAPHYRIDLRRDDNLDTLELTVELEEGFDGSTDDVREKILNRLSNVLSFTPDELTLVESGGIARTEVGKVQRVYDHRGQ